MVHTVLNEWDKKLEVEVMRAIRIGHGIKCRKKPGVYNFTGLVLSNDVFEVLNMGKNAIPDYKIPFRVRRTKFRESLLKALQGYRFRVQRSYQIYAQCPREWLRKVIEATEKDLDDGYKQEHLAYYQFVLGNLSVVYRKLQNEEKYHRRLGKMTVREARANLDMRDVMYSEADKNLGISLIPCGELERAQNAMVKELGGTRTDLCSKDLNVILGEKVKKFEGGLVLIENQIMDAIIPAAQRKIRVSGARTPYLKLNMKIQKLSDSQLSRSQLGDFKYRPIQDSVGSLLKPYSRICMELLRSLNKTVKVKYNSVWKIETMNGVEISRRFENLESEKRDYKTILSMDFDSAYTNVSKDDLVR